MRADWRVLAAVAVVLGSIGAPATQGGVLENGFATPPDRSSSDRLKLQLATGTGGPRVKPEQSMQHLVASATDVVGPRHFDAVLEQLMPHESFFGCGLIADELKKDCASF